MSLVEQLSKNISGELGKRLNKTEEEVSVMNYGLVVLIHNTISIVSIILVGILTNMIVEVISITVSSTLFKRYSGGVHATSPTRCTIMGIVFSVLLSVVCKVINSSVHGAYNLVLVISSYTIALYVLYKKCPVPSKNKPMRSENTRKRLRKKAFKTTIIMLFIDIVLYILYSYYNINLIETVLVGMLLGMLLQIFVLTNLGNKCIESVDRVLKIAI